MKADMEKILLPEEQIDEKVKEIANKISEDYDGKELIMIGILKASVIFMSDLVKKITSTGKR